ncbi:hypothetical protein LDENG_00141500 [Lucifuga dentata]|nr:hypothetical protein LDENG_00141500 [Lucifuga dentata]
MSFKPESFANLDTLHCLGVIFDSNLNFDQHVTKLVQSCFLQLSHIAKVSSYLPKNVISQIIRAFISSRLGDCNSLFSCLTASAASRLQMVQNAAARLLTRTKRREHITPILASLHWLPVHFRIQFKILLITFKATHGLAPSYISAFLTPYIAPRPLRSADQKLLHIPWSRFKPKGDRAFSVVAPTLWNQLLLNIRSVESVQHFKKLIKTYLYKQVFMYS